jgi:hypothetical protein
MNKICPDSGGAGLHMYIQLEQQIVFHKPLFHTQESSKCVNLSKSQDQFLLMITILSN